MTLRLVVGIVLAGAAGALVAASFLRGSALDALGLAAAAGGSSLGVGLAVAFLLWVLRRSSLATQLLLVTFGTVGAVAAGALVSAETMFAAQRQYPALALVLVSSGTASALVGVWLSHRVREGSDSLAQAARNLGQGDAAAQIGEPPTEELARLARELELTAKRLDESRAHAAQLDASRRELVAWISHDLRTPLARIRAVVEALDDRVVSDSADVASFHKRLRDETDRLTGLVDGLFELSRINAGTLVLDLERLDLADVVSDLVASFAPLATTRGIELRASRHATPVVEASLEHLERAITNLVDNAIRYSDEGGVVVVQTGERPAGAYVSIADSCGGISSDELEHIFDVPAVRHVARRSNSGTGLGLAIAKGLIEAHSGAITVELTERGCRFTLTLPGVPLRPSGAGDAVTNS